MAFGVRIIGGVGGSCLWWCGLRRGAWFVFLSLVQSGVVGDWYTRGREESIYGCGEEGGGRKGAV